MRCLAPASDRRRCSSSTRPGSQYCDEHQDWASPRETHPFEAGFEARWSELSVRLRGVAPRRSPPDLAQELLSHPDNMVRWQAAFALRKRRDPAAVEPLWEALSSDNSRLVRQQVAVALGTLGTPAALAPLIQALWHDPDAGVRQAAAIAIGNLGFARAGDELALAIERESVPFVRWDCILALGRVGNHSHIPLLRRLAEQESAEYARMAFRQALDLLLSR